MYSVGLGFVAGLVGWTFLEYVIHFWLGHLPKGKILISSEHLKHHADILYFTPLRLKLRGAIPVLSALLVVVGIPFGLAVGAGFVCAVAIGWTTYEWLHQSIHVHGPTNWYSRWAARQHLSHHFALPNRNHGVTTPLWDLLLGTYRRPSRIRIGRRHVASIPWMAAALEPGSARPAFLADYEVL